MHQSKNQASATLSLPVAGTDLRVVQYSVHEALSAPFQARVEFACTDPKLPLEDIIGKSAALSLDGGMGQPLRHVTGIVDSIHHIGGGAPYHSYAVVIVPPLATLDYRSDNRIFQRKNVVTIVTEVMTDAGIPGSAFEFKPIESYPDREYCLQYHESDLNFIHRLLAEEGLWYYFDHQPEGSVMVVVDANQSCTALPGKPELRHTPDGGVAHDTFIKDLEVVEQLATGAFRQRDYTFRRPADRLETFQEFGKRPELEIYRYPGRYKADAAGTPFSRIWLQAKQCRTTELLAAGNHMPFCPGKTIAITSDTRPELAGTYLIVDVRHSGSQPQSLEQYGGEGSSTYANTATLIPVSVPFRTDIPTKPNVLGPQTAMVVGPPGEEIYVDEYARVKVQFHWDRYGARNEHSSAWVRVSQPWAGGGWGGMFIPRIGHEVIVDFLDGDPDQPIITGRVYNAASMPPYKLPDKKTISTIKTQSHKSKGANEIRFDDATGAEELFLHAQKNMEIRVRNDQREAVERDRHKKVGRDAFEAIDANAHLVIKADSHTRIGGDLHHKTDGARLEEAGASVSLKAGTTVVIEAGTQITLKVGGSFVSIHAGGVDIVGPAINLNSGGSAGSPDLPMLPKNALDAIKATLAPPAQTQVWTRAMAQASTLKSAAQDGYGLCAICNAPKSE